MITSSTAFSSEHREMFEAAAGLRLGPFRIGNGGGSSQVIQDKSVTQHEFSGGSDSETPLIASVTIQTLCYAATRKPRSVAPGLIAAS